MSGTVTRVCACRLPIEAAPDPVSIEHAVSVHQAEPEHVYWRQREQLMRELLPAQPVRIGMRGTVLRRVG